METNYKKLEKELKRYRALSAALTLFSFDSDTYAPEGSFEMTMSLVSTLSEEAFNILMGDYVKTLVQACLQEPLSEMELKVVQKVAKEHERMACFSKEEYSSYQTLLKKAQMMWVSAKQNNDFESFAPYLKEVIDVQKTMAKKRRKDGQTLYDVLLGDYEDGMTEKEYDHFFNLIKEKVVPLINQMPRIERPNFLNQSYDIEKQKDFNTWLADYIGFDLTRGKISETEHPYTTSLHNHDVRFTNHYHLNRVESAIFSTIHEGGHGIYEQQVSDDLTLTHIGHDISSGMHESQSRFMENCIGRSKEFWEGVYPKLQETFCEQLKDVTLEDWMTSINAPEKSLIRIEADELTYPLHIVIRYELEKEIINGDVAVEDLPKKWNALYKEYLGVDVPNDTKGILQDLHWSGGMFGYFPTYALGSAIAAQIHHYLLNEEDLTGWLKDGKLDGLCAWLKENIHQFGGLKNTQEVLMDSVKEPFNPNYYVDYLLKKYSSLAV